MRKGLILLAVLLLTGAAAVTYMDVKLRSDLEAVTFTEDVLEGDRSGAEGLSITVRSCLDDSVRWESTLNYEQGELKVTTEASCDPDVPGSRYSDSVLVGVMLDDLTGYHVDGEPLMNGQRLEKYDSILDELKEAAAPGETVSRRLYLSELYEFYPITTWINLPGGTTIGGSWNWSEGYKPGSLETYLLGQVEEYFRIPVLPDDSIMIGYTRG